MKAKKSTLKVYWEDGITIECRYFPSISRAKSYVKANGIRDYKIEVE